MMFKGLNFFSYFFFFKKSYFYPHMRKLILIVCRILFTVSFLSVLMLCHGNSR